MLSSARAATVIVRLASKIDFGLSCRHDDGGRGECGTCHPSPHTDGTQALTVVSAFLTKSLVHVFDKSIGLPCTFGSNACRGFSDLAGPSAARPPLSRP